MVFIFHNILYIIEIKFSKIQINENLIDLIKFDEHFIKHGETLINFYNVCEKSICCNCNEHIKHKISSYINIGLKINEKKILKILKNNLMIIMKLIKTHYF